MIPADFSPAKRFQITEACGAEILPMTFAWQRWAQGHNPRRTVRTCAGIVMSHSSMWPGTRAKLTNLVDRTRRPTSGASARSRSSFQHDADDAFVTLMGAAVLREGASEVHAGAGRTPITSIFLGERDPKIFSQRSSPAAHTDRGRTARTTTKQRFGHRRNRHALILN
jgi:hypothetical protein